MPTRFRRLLVASFALLLVSLLPALLGLQRGALVPATAPVSVGDIDRAHALLLLHYPRDPLPGIARDAVLSQRDLELLLDQAGRRLGELRARVTLAAGSARLQASVPVDGGPFGHWLNIDAELRETGALPRITALRVGSLPLPAALARLALPALLDAAGLRAQRELALRMVSRVRLQPQQLALTYAWPDDPRQTLSDTLLAPAARERLRLYVARLAALAAPLPRSSVSMVQLMPPLFALAQQRSAAGADAAVENRAALLALALVANRGALDALVPASRGWPPVRPLRVTLLGRSDFPLHLLISAVIAAEQGGVLADAIGVYKELADSRGGSGFSFNDIAADRAGTRLGLQAVRSPRALQQRLAAGVTEAELMPAVDDLPEFLAAAEFERRFGGIDGPGYRSMMARIEARLDALALLAEQPLQ